MSGASVPDAVTLSEAHRLMDPPMPLRTLQSRVRNAEAAGDIAHVAMRTHGAAGGRPAREYRASDLFALHQKWALGTQGKKSGIPRGLRKPPGGGKVRGASGRMRSTTDTSPG